MVMCISSKLDMKNQNKIKQTNQILYAITDFKFSMISEDLGMRQIFRETFNFIKYDFIFRFKKKIVSYNNVKLHF